MPPDKDRPDADSGASFLARWSRRKRAADSEQRPPAVAPPEAAAAPAPAEVMDPDDLAKRLAELPKLEDITALTDARMFFQSWVPQAVRNAALRRIWATDPAIRDFIEVADYQMDWNTPGGAPGYGPLEPDFDLQGFVKGLFAEADGEGRFVRGRDVASQDETSEISVGNAAAQQENGVAETADPAETRETTAEPAASVEQGDAAAQQDGESNVIPFAPRKKRHGGALPNP